MAQGCEQFFLLLIRTVVSTPTAEANRSNYSFTETISADALAEIQTPDQGIQSNTQPLCHMDPKVWGLKRYEIDYKSKHHFQPPFYCTKVEHDDPS